MDVDAFRQARFIAKQAFEFGLQRVRQGVGECCQQDASVGLSTRQMYGAMQGNYGLASAGRAGNSRRTEIVALYPLSLFGVQKDGPLFPREFKRAFQLFN